MKPTVTFDSAQISCGESGPETVVLVGKDQRGATHDFVLELPQGAAEKYLRDLGFESWLVREPGKLRLTRSGRAVPGTLETRVTAAGERTLLTKNAVGAPDGEPGPSES